MNWRTLFHRKPVVVEHVRYVNKDARRAIRAKAASMYRERGMAVPEVLEGRAS